MDKKIQELKNGLKIVTIKNENTKFASLKIGINVGSLDECENNYGISHFLEHLLFSGTEKYSEVEIQRQLSLYAGDYNAYTYNTRTTLVSDTLVEDLDKTLEIFSDMLMNTVISDEVVNKERNVVISELRLAKDDFDGLGWDVAYETAFKGQSISTPILGYEDIINNLTKEDIRKYYKTYYVPNNTVVSIVSPLEHNKVVEKIDNYLGMWSVSNNDIPERNVGKGMISGYFEVNIGSSNQEGIYVLFNCDDATKEEHIMLGLLASRLGGGMSSILWKKLRNELGITYSTYAYYTKMMEKGVFAVYANTSPEHTDICVKAIKDAIEEIQTIEGIQENLDISRKEYLVDMAKCFESNSRLSGIYLERVMSGKSLDFYEEYEKIIKNCTIEELQRLSKRVLVNPCTVISKVSDVL